MSRQRASKTKLERYGEIVKDMKVLIVSLKDLQFQTQIFEQELV